MQPFNQLVHDFLIENGYTHERVEADWEDIGDAENGPNVVGHNAYDQYSITVNNVTECVYVGERGDTGRDVFPDIPF